RLSFSLSSQRLPQGCPSSSGKSCLDLCEREGRLRRELLRKGLGRAGKVSRGKGGCCQLHVVALLSAQLAPECEELESASAEVVRRPVRASAIGHEADIDEALLQVGLLAHEANVAGEGHVGAEADGSAV